MPVIRIKTVVNAPIGRVLDLARCINLHEATMLKHKEKAVAGVTKGLIELGESVTWEATHFGVRQRLTSKITEYKHPFHFRDSMVKGIFKQFDHDHFFEETDTGTLMKDIFDYSSPLSFLGEIADYLFLKSYMEEMLIERNELIKEVAEGESWKNYINPR